MDLQKREQTYLELLAAAREAMAHSYAPYSDFQVGCAVLTADGQVYTGCNIENVNFAGTICAERTAFVKAISAGQRRFSVVAVVSRRAKDCWPCGLCRQFMSEFGDDFQIVVESADGSVKNLRMSELLPQSQQPNAHLRQDCKGVL